MSMDSESGNRFRGSDMRPERKSKDRPEAELDRELLDLPPELRWREWMRRIEAVLFASASPVPREDLARIVGQGTSVDLLSIVLNIIYIAIPVANRFDFDIIYLNIAIMLTISVFGIQIFLLLPFEIMTIIQSLIKKTKNSSMFDRFKKATFWKHFMKSIFYIVVSSLFIRELLFWYFGYPELTEQGFRYQGGWLETLIYFISLIVLSVFVIFLKRYFQRNQKKEPQA